MEAINSLEDFDRLKARNAVVCWYLADGYASATTDWLLQSWLQLHRDSGDHWHICVPVRKGASRIADGGFAVEDLSPDLAIKIADHYGISVDHFPCIVFDDFEGSSKQKFLKLAGLNSEKLREFFRDNSKFIGSKYLEPNPRAAEVINAVCRREKWRPFATWLSAERAVSILSAIRGLLV